MPVAVDRHEVRRLLTRGAQLIDVLPPREYAHAHLRGAVNIPLKTMTRDAVAGLDPDRPVIAYCYDFQ
jgi:rhodanese-related sulfurtransferase